MTRKWRERKPHLKVKSQQPICLAQEKSNQLAEFNRQSKEKGDALDKQIAGLKGDLAEAQTRANARMKLSKEIAKALKDAGVSADVNPNTGDVTIAFNGDYFDNGSASLKPTMANVLQKFIPKYSESLFKDANIASKITFGRYRWVCFTNL